MANTTQPDTSRYKIIKFFNKPIVDQILKEVSDKPLAEGSSTLEGPRTLLRIAKALKQNREYGGQEFSNYIYSLSGPDFNLDWARFCKPKRMSNVIYSSMRKGDYYKPHIDSGELGHFSTTIFLNNPKTYVGGELELLIDGELQTFKLRPGYGVIYETGTPHQVKEIVSGERKVLVFWTTSLISNMLDLYQYRAWETYGIKQLADKNQHFYPSSPEDVAETLEEFVNKKPVQALGAMNEIVRKYL